MARPADGAARRRPARRDHRPRTCATVGRLTTFGWQQRLVAPNLVSLAEALVPGTDDDGGRLVPWYRAIEADGELVGFVMVAEPTTTLPDAFLWRLMIDRRHQRRGIGQRVLALVIEQAVAWAATELLVGWEPGLGSPRRFYLRNGFVPTGEVVRRRDRSPVSRSTPAARLRA